MGGEILTLNFKLAIESKPKHTSSLSLSGLLATASRAENAGEKFRGVVGELSGMHVCTSYVCMFVAKSTPNNVPDRRFHPTYRGYFFSCSSASIREDESEDSQF